MYQTENKRIINPDNKIRRMEKPQGRGEQCGESAVGQRSAELKLNEIQIVWTRT
jgi:hypothetical protein